MLCDFFVIAAARGPKMRERVWGAKELGIAITRDSCWERFKFWGKSSRTLLALAGQKSHSMFLHDLREAWGYTIWYIKPQPQLIIQSIFQREESVHSSSCIATTGNWTLTPAAKMGKVKRSSSAASRMRRRVPMAFCLLLALSPSLILAQTSTISPAPTLDSTAVSGLEWFVLY